MQNMKCLMFVVLVFSVIIGLTGGQNDESNKLATYFYEKCKTATGNTKVFDKIYFESGEFSKELSLAFQNLPENKRLFCKENRPSLHKHFNIIANDLDSCLFTPEKYLTEFLKTSFSQFLHFLCHNNGEYIDMFFSNNAKRCRTSLESNNESQVGKCFEKIFKPSGGYLFKKDMCDDLNTAKKCFDVVIDEKCPAYQPYKDLNSHLFKYISTPCSSCQINFSIILLVASTLFSYFYR